MASKNNIQTRGLRENRLKRLQDEINKPIKTSVDNVSNKNI